MRVFRNDSGCEISMKVQYLQIDGYEITIQFVADAKSPLLGKFWLGDCPPFIASGYFDTYQEAFDHAVYEVRKWQLKNPQTLSEWFDQISECVEEHEHGFDINEVAMKHVLDRYVLWTKRNA